MKFQVGDVVIIKDGSTSFKNTRAVIYKIDIKHNFGAYKVNSPAMEKKFNNKGGLAFREEQLELDPISLTPLFQALL